MPSSVLEITPLSWRGFWIWIWLLLLSRMKIITNATTTSRKRRKRRTTTKATTREGTEIFMELVIFMQIAKSQSKLSQRFKKMTLKCCCCVQFASLSPDPFLHTYILYYSPHINSTTHYCIQYLCVCVCNRRVEWFIYKHVPPIYELAARIMVQFSFDLSFQFNPLQAYDIYIHIYGI